MTITLSMRNVVSVDVKTIMLRKFFQMVFVGNDRKSLHIYTATVIGASDESYTQDNLSKEENFVSRFKNIPDFRMLFDYTVSGNDTNEVTDIKHEDITGNSKKGMFSQLEHLKKVWGNKCTLIYNDQKSLNEALEDIACATEGTANVSKYNVLSINEEKSVYKFLFKSLSVQGAVVEDVDIGAYPPKKEDYTKRAAYAIDVPVRNLPDGIELVNWVRTTITFKSVIDDKDFNYCLQNPSLNSAARDEAPLAQSMQQSGADSEGEPASGIAGKAYEFLCPDFTWYFSPPVKSFIDHRNASVEIKKTQPADNCVNCPCAYRGTPPPHNSSKKYHDGIGPVPNKLTVEFDYWVKEERINSRQKYRFAAKDIPLGAEEFSSVSEIMICLDMTDDHSRGNRQYIMGLFISFALSFGIDSGRLNKVSQYFPTVVGLDADSLWLIFLVIFSLAMLCRPPKISDKKDVCASIVRRTCLYASFAWFAFVFSVTNFRYLQWFFTIHQQGIELSTRISYGVIVLVEFFYLVYLKVRHNDRIFSGLFGEDIL